MQTQSIAFDDVDLAEIGAVPADYQHERRFAEPGDPLLLPEAVLKWYDVHRHDWEIPAAIDAQARRVVERDAPAALEGGYGLGFVVHHQSTTGYYLLMMTWHGHQEMWRSVYARATAPDADFNPVPLTAHGPTGCVWELGPICYESGAWSRYLFSNRDLAAKRAFLADLFTGDVGSGRS